MAKIDFKKELRELYRTSAKEPVEVAVPPLRYLMIDGQGDPNTSAEYGQAVEALFTVSYTAKFAVKRGPTAIDYAVMPLEGLWWADDLSVFSTTNDRTQWKWTMMILQPPMATDDVIQNALSAAEKKKGLPGIAKLRLEEFREGHSAQILHVGPFAEEGPTIERLHDFIDTRGAKTGKHHEIYLSDIRRAAPERWKTVIRQPMIAATE